MLSSLDSHDSIREAVRVKGRKKCRFFLAGLLMVWGCVGLTASKALAQVDFKTEQSKVNTEDAGPVEPGHFEVEFAYGFSTGRHRYAGSGDREDRGRLRDHTYDLGFNMGVIRNFELNFGIAYADMFDKDNTGPTHGHGWTDTEIGSKIQFYHSD